MREHETEQHIYSKGFLRKEERVSLALSVKGQSLYSRDGRVFNCKIRQKTRDIFLLVIANDMMAGTSSPLQWQKAARAGRTYIHSNGSGEFKRIFQRFFLVPFRFHEEFPDIAGLDSVAAHVKFIEGYDILREVIPYGFINAECAHYGVLRSADSRLEHRAADSACHIQNQHLYHPLFLWLLYTPGT